MKQIAITVALLAGCAEHGEGGDPLHAVGDCGALDADRDCEAACFEWNNLPMPGTTCTGTNANASATAACGSGATPVVEFMGATGCCGPQGDVWLFFECEP